MLTALIPTVLMTVIGIVLVATGGSKSASVVGRDPGAGFLRDGADRVHAGNDLRHARRQPGGRAERVPVVGVARAAHAADVDPHVHRHAARGARPRSRREAALPHGDPPGAGAPRRPGRQAVHAVEDRVAPRRLRAPPVAVADIVNDALASFEAVRFAAPSDLEVDVEPGLLVWGDQAALAQAVANLLANAWKYTPAKERRIAISATSDVEHVIIAVTDNGAGVPRREQEAIFEKFRRGKAADDTGSAGTGLGLAVVRAIVKAHKGKVDVRADADAGRASASSCRARGRRRRDDGARPPRRRARTIVEDDAAIAEGLALNLRLQGYRTETVGDGEIALGPHPRAKPVLVSARHLAAQAERPVGARAAARRGQPRARDRAVGAPGRVRQGRGAAPRAPTTTSPSRSRSPSCWRASPASCGACASAGPSRRPRRPRPRASPSATSPSTSGRAPLARATVALSHFTEGSTPQVPVREQRPRPRARELVRESIETTPNARTAASSPSCARLSAIQF